MQAQVDEVPNQSLVAIFISTPDACVGVRQVRIPAVLSARDTQDMEHMYLDALVSQGYRKGGGSATGEAEVRGEWARGEGINV